MSEVQTFQESDSNRFRIVCPDFLYRRHIFRSGSTASKRRTRSRCRTRSCTVVHCCLDRKWRISSRYWKLGCCQLRYRRRILLSADSLWYFCRAKILWKIFDDVLKLLQSGRFSLYTCTQMVLFLG